VNARALKHGAGTIELVSKDIAGGYTGGVTVTITGAIWSFHNFFGAPGTWQGARKKVPAALCRKIAIAKLTGQSERVRTTQTDRCCGC